MFPWHLGPEGLQSALGGLPLPAWRFYPQVNSTNDEALSWAAAGAPEGCLVVAEAQQQGRGRSGRRWWTRAGAALIFTLVARPLPAEQIHLPRFTAWAAVALAETLKETYALPAEIKWPNDVLIRGRKIAGVLAEAVWEGRRPQAVVVGMGINLAPESVPPPEAVDFPAGSIADALGETPSRWPFLANILRHMLTWRYRLASAAFLKTWESALAFRQCIVRAEGLSGTLLGLDPRGALRLRLPSGEIRTLQALTGHLRPVDSQSKLT